MTTAVEKQSPGGVGTISDLMASAMDTAVEAADERPHFLISAPPASSPRAVILTSFPPNLLCWSLYPGTGPLQSPNGCLQHGAIRCTLSGPHKLQLLCLWGQCGQTPAMALPRVATVGVNSSLSQFMSLMISVAGRPAIFAFTKSGTCNGIVPVSMHA